MEYKNKRFTGERALFGEKGSCFDGCIFDDGESPLKHSQDIKCILTAFEWKYPLWYSRDISLENCTFHTGARAGIWYTENISLRNCSIGAPKEFRRSKGIHIENSSFTDAKETLWSCEDVSLVNVSSNGDYFGMNSKGIRAENFSLDGNYAFDGASDCVFENCRLITKDAFWNCEHIIVRNSFISGEYIGWNSKDITFENCIIESLQGLCYIEGLKMKGCRLVNTDRAFEYSTVDADIRSDIISVKNPSGGVIRAESIGEVIMDPARIDPSATAVIQGEQK